MGQNILSVNEEKDRARAQAATLLEFIGEMLASLAQTEASVESWDEAERGDPKVWQQVAAYEEVQDEIRNSALSVEVRTDWHNVGAVDAAKPTHYKILLCWGGPAVQIIGTLDDYNQPNSAVLQYQDWFTEWMDYPLTQAEEQTLMKYAQHFYFDE